MDNEYRKSLWLAFGGIIFFLLTILTGLDIYFDLFKVETENARLCNGLCLLLGSGLLSGLVATAAYLAFFRRESRPKIGAYFRIFFLAIVFYVGGSTTVAAIISKYGSRLLVFEANWPIPVENVLIAIITGLFAASVANLFVDSTGEATESEGENVTGPMRCRRRNR